MEHRQLNAFVPANNDSDVKLAIARDLERQWSSVIDRAAPAQPSTVHQPA